MWRVASFAAAHTAKLPTGLARVRIDAVAHFRGRAPVRDTANLAPTLKAVVDGLGPERHYRWRGIMRHSVGYGLIPDDSDKHLDGPYWVIGEALQAKPYATAGQLVVTITEVPHGA
jgi:crossover junction endodeoxyribonuclease RusA